MTYTLIIRFLEHTHFLIEVQLMINPKLAQTLLPYVIKNSRSQPQSFSLEILQTMMFRAVLFSSLAKNDLENIFGSGMVSSS